MRKFLGVAGALFFVGSAIETVSSGYWRQGFAIMFLWLACAYWRRGEGLDDSYNKRQSFIAGGRYGLMGLVIQRLDNIVLPDAESSVLIMYMTAAAFLMMRLFSYAEKSDVLATSNASFKGLITLLLFQQPEQVRKHTQG